MFYLEEGKVKFIPPVIEKREIEDRGFLNFYPSLKESSEGVDSLDINIGFYYGCLCVGFLETSCYDEYEYFSYHVSSNHKSGSFWKCPNCDKELELDLEHIFECNCGSLLEHLHSHNGINMWSY